MIRVQDAPRQSQQQQQRSWLWNPLFVSGRPGVGAEDCAWAVHGCLATCILQLRATFGPGLAKLRARAVPREMKTLEFVGPYCDALLGTC